jgi:hypothetical protein
MIDHPPDRRYAQSAKRILLLNVRDQLLDPFGIRPLDHLGSSETSLSIGRLLRQNVTCESLLCFYLPGPGLLKPFCCSSIGLQFGHVFLSFS